MLINEPLIFEIGSEGRSAYSLPDTDVPETDIKDILPEGMLREDISGFPEVSEADVVRHFTRLSRLNYNVDHGFYPLGSCTMKYNPRINEDVARLPGFSMIHPYQPPEISQGILKLMYELELYLAEISGMDRISLQPAAGAQGELAGMLMIRAYHTLRDDPRKKVILPDSSHGTNPASVSLCGYRAIEIKSDKRGLIDPKKLRQIMDEDVAALMLTNPNTLGLFEKDILEITGIVHDKGGIVYCDGANLNALLGIARLGDMGIDVLHFNLHKTFSTPHGGGGPGAGPIGIKDVLSDFLPVPVIKKEGDSYQLNYNVLHSIGKVKAFYGNIGVLIKAYAYIRTMGADGLRRVSEVAVINANYIRNRLQDFYDIPYNSHCMHECVLSDKIQGKHGITALDIAKSLIDYGFHPPTIYFPLIVKGAMMIEPTETETKETLDRFIEAMIDIAMRAEDDPESLRHAPSTTKVGRLDEVRAARKPNLRWRV